ncbi:sugar ABC transporter ATP-binding protein [Flindersiella endophytica]
MSAQTVLAMRGIGKSFPGVRALDGISLEVRSGEVHALLGENGAGKSTLCNILSGAFPHYDGEIEVRGEPANIHSPRDAQALGIAMIHQELELVPDMSIADNIFLGREPRTKRGTIDRRSMRTRSSELLAGLGLRLDPRRLIRHCRIAEQQLIEVAKALSLSVSILIMDEPTSALADAEVRRLFDVIRTLTARGVAVVYISHRLEELDEIADRVTVLRDGTYVGTVLREHAERAELIRMMVGRPLGELFPRLPATEGDAPERLRAENLCLEGDSRAGRAALHNVDLSVRAGEIVGLAGLMGAGRTEVLSAIYGAYADHLVRGRLTVDGARYRPRSPAYAIRRGLALVAEDRKTESLVPGNTVRFNASLAALKAFRRWFGVDARQERAAVAAQVEALRIRTPGLTTTVANLSGGNQQKVVLAKCLLTKPSVLLMDEPTRGIDVGAKAEIYALMSELAGQGAAIVMASSELPELLSMCDRILVLCEGRVTAEFAREEATQERVLEAATARQVVVSNATPSPEAIPDPDPPASDGVS